MHARYIIVWCFVFVLLVLLAPACIAKVDSAAPQYAEKAKVHQEDEAPIDITKRFMYRRLGIK